VIAAAVMALLADPALTHHLPVRRAYIGASAAACMTGARHGRQ
jgi:hypothetical protein